MYYLPYKKFLGSFSFLTSWWNRPVVGVSITERAIRWSVVSKTGDAHTPYHILSYGTKPIPAGAMMDSEIKKPDVLLGLVKHISRVTKCTQVALVIPESVGYTLTLHTAANRPADIAKRIRQHIEEQLPAQVLKTVFYYTHIRKIGTAQEILIRVLPTEYMKKYRALFRAAGMTLIASEVESDSIARVVSRLEERDMSIVLNIGAQESVVAIVGQGHVYLNSTVLVGASDITQAIQKSGGKEHDISRRVGEKEVLYSVATILDTLIAEVERQAEHWHKTMDSHANTAPITGVLLSGIDVTIPGIERYIAEKCTVPVAFANIWKNVHDFNKTIPSLMLEESLEYAPTIASAIGVLAKR